MRDVLTGLILFLSLPLAMQATTAINTPEPGTLLLVGGGLAAVVLLARNRRKS